ncbi:protein of unknown function [Burkholderia multivorans]
MGRIERGRPLLHQRRALPPGHVGLCTGAGDESRTRDLNLGKVALYQLSYSRITGSPTWARTRDLRINSPALYRLSYRGRGGRLCMPGGNLASLLYVLVTADVWPSRARAVPMAPASVGMATLSAGTN